MVIFAKVYYQIVLIKNRFHMKKLLFLFLLVPMNIWAQDVIVKKDGTTILAKVNKVGTKEVEYKKWKNRNGPTYTINIEDIQSINYQNGEKDLFNEASSSTSSSYEKSNNNGPKRITKKAADYNLSLINRYKTDIREIGAPSKENATYCNVYLGITSNSIIANEDIEIIFTQVENGKVLDYAFDIEIKNKTNRVIYIDKGNCFRVINGNQPYCYYNATEQTTVGDSGGMGASLGLGSVAGALGIGGIVGQIAGGVSVGGGSSRSSSVTYSPQRVIAIPPHSTKKLCENKLVNITKETWKKIIDPNEDFRFFYYGDRTDGSFESCYNWASHFGLYKGDLKLGQVLNFTEQTTPYRRDYYITYSTSESFNNYTTMEFSLYMQQAYGTKKWSDKGKKNIDNSRIDRVIVCRNARINKK